MPTGFYIGNFQIYYYGIIIMLGAVAGAYLAYWLANSFGEDGDRIWDIMPWVLAAGIVGARIWHILTPPASMVAQGITFSYYLTHPLDMLNTRSGGLGIPGAVIGGVIALYFYCRAKKISFLRWVDLIVPGLALAQAIGRWGNFINQEVYGAPSSLPWAITIDLAHRLPGFDSISTYHPLFLYESLWNLQNAAVLVFLGIRFAKWLKKGDIFLIYLVTYPAMRFLLEFIRLDPSPVGGINANQTLMGAIAVISLGFLIYRHARPSSPEENAMEEPDETDMDASPEE
ncbi:MAG: prolipoprotein diacylglyceryl transferase [Anaerolineaceae bacterium]